MKRLLRREKKITGEWLKTKQYFVSVLIDVVIICAVTYIKWKWGSMLIGKDKVTLGFMMYCMRNLVLVFAAINLISTLQHFYVWNSSGRTYSEDDAKSIFSNWKTGEISPVNVSLAVVLVSIVILFCIIIMWL